MELNQIYNSIATDFSQTRQKIRPEFEIIKDIIWSYPSKNINILDVGAGDGRLWGYLKNELTNHKISYQWIDFSDNLVQIAQNRFPDAQWIVDDMKNLQQHFEPLSQDFVIFVASFHHLRNLEERINVLQQTYQILKYWGKIILINRNLWNPRYYKLFVLNVLKNFLSLRRSDLNWVQVPWKKDGKILQRYYHIFGVKEINNLLQLAGFENTQHFFVNNKKQISSQRRWARNLVTIATKVG